MTLTKKIIEFNPAFLGGSSKTKKNRAPRVAPLISPNVLRNRLLKRIKEHKKKELSLSGKKVNENLINSSILSNTEERNNSTNEFDDSFTFLEDLAKKQQQTTNILNKSIKHRPLFPTQTNVHLDLPDELKPETTFTVSPPSVLFPLPLPPPPNVFSVVGDGVPYGILKGGNKPTFRDWNKTRKNLEPMTTIGAPAGIKPENSHSQKLKDLQLKLNALTPQIPASEPVLQAVQPPKAPSLTVGGGDEKPHVKSTPLGRKKLLKRTIRRKYTLGKSKLKKSVSILLKDRETRKNVLIAHRALKTVPLSDINVYLKKQNLIKIGSAAPADVVRQIYESALLAGEITNVNKDVLLHNFIKGEPDTIF
jgi:hypothetical protein